jgi:polyphosphate kinase 2 (PPK2 family)
VCVQAEIEGVLDEEYELEMSEPALSMELRKIYKQKHPPTLDRTVYFRALLALQAELIEMHGWVAHYGEKVAVIFEGRDAAGKGV